MALLPGRNGTRAGWDAVLNGVIVQLLPPSSLLLVPEAMTKGQQGHRADTANSGIIVDTDM